MIPRIENAHGQKRAWCLICGRMFGSDQGFRVHFGKAHKSLKLPFNSWEEWNNAARDYLKKQGGISHDKRTGTRNP